MFIIFWVKFYIFFLWKVLTIFLNFCKAEEPQGLGNNLTVALY